MSSKSRRSTKSVEPVVEDVVPTPVVEVATVEAVAEEVTETYETVATRIRENMAQRAVLDKAISADMKLQDRLHSREVKLGGKSKRSQPKKDRAPSGFAKATPVPEALRKFLKLADDVELPRTEVAKQIYSYVREENLRDKEDRRIIHPDAALRKLFTLKEGETLDFKNFQKQLSRHYPKAVAKEAATKEVSVPVPVVVEEAHAPVASEGSKRRSRGATSTA